MRWTRFRPPNYTGGCHSRGPTDEIGRLAATMNRMLARLEDSRNSQRRFVSDASHELRSPLTTIREHSEVALAHPEGTTAEELADVVLAEELRMQRLVEDMLLLARADEHAAPQRAAVDLDDLVFEEARRLRSTTAVRVDTSAVGAARVQGDVDGLRRVVRNLADNAARHAAGRIDLALSEHGGEVRLTIDDDGPGIPESERERVLKRFVRLDEARSRDDGGSWSGSRDRRRGRSGPRRLGIHRAVTGRRRTRRGQIARRSGLSAIQVAVR